MKNNYKFTREDYLKVILDIGGIKVPSKKSTELYMTTTEDGKILAMAFSGKKAKYDFYANFRNIDERDQYVNDWEERLLSWDRIILARKNKRAEIKSTKIK